MEGNVLDSLGNAKQKIEKVNDPVFKQLIVKSLTNVKNYKFTNDIKQIKYIFLKTVIL